MTDQTSNLVSVVRQILATATEAGGDRVLVHRKYIGQLREALPRSGDETPALHVDWVNCPICDEPDMRKTTDRDGYVLIHCVNHACASNGGTNRSAVKTSTGACRVCKGEHEPPECLSVTRPTDASA